MSSGFAPVNSMNSSRVRIGFLASASIAAMGGRGPYPGGGVGNRLRGGTGNNPPVFPLVVFFIILVIN